MPKSWRRKFSDARPTHVVTLEKRFAGVPAGGRLFIPSPTEIAAYIDAIPRGETRTVAAMRSAFAERAGAYAACPVTSAIHLRIVAECALEEMAAGRAPSEVTPFWRLIEPGGTIARKLTCDGDFLSTMRESEATSETSP